MRGSHRRLLVRPAGGPPDRNRHAGHWRIYRRDPIALPGGHGVARHAGRGVAGPERRMHHQ